QSEQRLGDALLIAQLAVDLQALLDQGTACGHIRLIRGHTTQMAQRGRNTRAVPQTTPDRQAFLVKCPSRIQNTRRFSESTTPGERLCPRGGVCPSCRSSQEPKEVVRAFLVVATHKPELLQRTRQAQAELDRVGRWVVGSGQLIGSGVKL